MESEHEHEGLGLCGVGVYRGSEAVSSRAGPGAVLLIVKTTAGNLAARSAEIGVLKAVGPPARDMHRQRLGEALVQSHLAGGSGIIIGYSMAYLLGLLSISVSASRDMNPLSAFVRKGGAAVQAGRLPVAVSARPTAAALG